MRFIANSFAVAAILGATVVASSAQTTLRFADYSPNRGIRAEYAMKFFDEIEKRSEGRIKVEQHWAQSLLPATDIFSGIKSGVASMGTTTASFSLEELFAFRVGDLPVSNPSEIAGNMALYELATTHPALQQEFEREGVVYLMNYPVGPIQLICKGGALKSVDDFHGKRIRATADYGAIYGTFGAIHAAIPLPEAYQALDTGLINCSQVFSYNAESYRLYEVTDSFTRLDSGTTQSHAIMMNRAEFDSLEEQDQEMLVALGKEYSELLGKAMQKHNAAVMESFAQGIDGRKLDVVSFGEDERAKLEMAGEPFIQDYIKEGARRGVDAESIVNEYKDLIKKYQDIYAE